MSSNIQWERAETEAVWIGQADSDGPTVAVLGGVHGDEPTGFAIVESSLESLNIDTGTVILMLGNLAARGKSRYIDTNLNRSFRALSDVEAELDPEQRSYEANRAQELLPDLDESSALLDLHDFTNPCPSFIICERNALAIARTIGPTIVSFGWSNTEPGGSDGYMFSQNKPGLCFEIGEKGDTQRRNELIHLGSGAVDRFLVATGLVDGSLAPLLSNNPKLVQANKAFVRTAEHFRLARDFENFEDLYPGELIAVHGDEEIHASESEVIIFPMANAKIGEEAFSIGQRVVA